jgi:OpgC protein
MHRVDLESGANQTEQPRRGRSRIDAIDFWRGFALLTIFADHMPYSVLAQVTHRNFGLSDAAEGFVFLSGMSAALAYGPRFLEGRAFLARPAAFRPRAAAKWSRRQGPLFSANYHRYCRSNVTGPTREFGQRLGEKRRRRSVARSPVESKDRVSVIRSRLHGGSGCEPSSASRTRHRDDQHTGRAGRL